MILKKCKYMKGILILGIWILFNVITFLLKSSALSLLCFWTFGIISFIILYYCFRATLKISKINLTKNDIMIFGISMCISFFIYLILVLKKDSIYTWDTSAYYKMMEALLNQFRIHNVAGFSELFKSGLIYDYGDFLQIYIYPFYAFTNHSIQAYIISFYFGTVVPVIFSLYIACLAIIKKITDNDLYKNFFIKFCISCILVFFPLLHAASINGQPDITGLVFVGMIITLTINYDFGRVELERWLILLFVTIELILTRRWYLFFIVSYYFSYISLLILNICYNKEFAKLKNTLINIFCFGISSVIISGIILFEMIIRILGNKYSESYAAWYMGGFKYELVNQFRFLGVLVSGIVICGLVYGLFKSNSRFLTFTFLSTYLIEMLLFTRVQNAWVHQSLIFVPFYLYCITLFLIFINTQFNKVRLLSNILVVTCILLSFINCSCLPNENNIVDLLFSNVDLYPEQRSDLKQINNIVNFLRKKSDFNNKVMFLAGSNKYDCSTFINYPTPGANDNIFYSNNYYAASEGFPEDFFTAKYIVVIDPIKQRDAVISEGVLATLKKCLSNNKIIASKFSTIAIFNLENHVKATIYERNIPIDNIEVCEFIKEFDYYCKRYPDMFKYKIRMYLK